MSCLEFRKKKEGSAALNQGGSDVFHMAEKEKENLGTETEKQNVVFGVGHCREENPQEKPQELTSSKDPPFSCAVVSSMNPVPFFGVDRESWSRFGE